MSTKILGINNVSHDVGSALIIDGKIVSIGEEERFNKKKHYAFNYPEKSIEWQLKNSKLKLSDIDVIAYGFDSYNFFDKPFDFSQKWERIYSGAPSSIYEKTKIKNRKMINLTVYLLRQLHYFRHAKNILKYRKRRNKILANNKEFPHQKIYHIRHHLAHASSAFRCSGFDKANIIVLDGRGEYDESTSLWAGKDNNIELIKSYPIDKSIGILYTIATKILKLGEFGEGKTMGLAPYGRYNEKYNNLVVIEKDDYHIDWKKVKKLINIARIEGELTQEHKDLAFMLQYQLEKLGVFLAEKLYEQTGIKNFALAGGVALNCPMNSRILNLDFTKDIYIQPGASDTGVALGAALQAYAELGKKCKLNMNHAYWGPEYTDEEIKKVLKKSEFEYEHYDDIEKVTAELVAKGNTVGWFQGKMEFGPRALGNRTILGDPRNPDMKDILNNKVKHREPWRPFAPSVNIEKMSKYFEKACVSPFMILNFDVKEDQKSILPAITHVDGSARVQSVDKKTNPKYHKLISEFEKVTGVAVVLNTSFNDKAQPIVCEPEDALLTLKQTALDYIAMGNFLVKRKEKYLGPSYQTVHQHESTDTYLHPKYSV